MKTDIAQIKPYVFFKFNNDVLEFVGINIKYNNACSSKLQIINTCKYETKFIH